VSSNFEYNFPAIRGLQAGREYFVSMCPLRIIPKIFLFDEDELKPELRAQRSLNTSRVPEIARYITENPNDYVFSALTASIDADIQFESVGTEGEASRVGVLQVPMDARFIINDGQHRRAAIEQALAERPELGHETIAVVFFVDRGLERCQQMFADLNRHAVRPSKSLGLLYDHRDENAQLARLVVTRSHFFRDLVEMERSTLSARSRKLFTLSAIYKATLELLDGQGYDEDTEGAAATAAEYWEAVAEHFPEWQQVRKGKMAAGEVRKDFIHSHGIVLQALGTAGNALIRRYPKSWKRRLKALGEIDWSRSNQELWEGRAMVGGRVTKASHNVTLTTNVIKQQLELELSPDEQRAEEAYLGGHHG